MGVGARFLVLVRPAALRALDVAPQWRLARLALGPQPVSVVTMADGPLLGLGLRGALGFGRRALSRAPGHADMGGSKPAV